MVNCLSTDFHLTLVGLVLVILVELSEARFLAGRKMLSDH